VILHAINRLRRCSRGAMAVETAVVAPVLALMSIGTVEIGTMVSRQQELQSGASEAESIILAAAGGTGTDSDTIEEVIEESLGLPDEQVSLEQRFRCNVENELRSDASACSTTAPIYRYVRLELSDSYTPVWARFGVGHAFDYDIERTIQVE
jgi:hypothetical protein